MIWVIRVIKVIRCIRVIYVRLSAARSLTCDASVMGGFEYSHVMPLPDLSRAFQVEQP